MHENTKVFMENNFGYWVGKEIFITQKHQDGIYLAKVEKGGILKWERQTEGSTMRPAPTIILTEEILEALLEEMKRQKIEYKGDARLQGELDATKYHLEDMRKLTFNETINTWKNETTHTDGLKSEKKARL